MLKHISSHVWQPQLCIWSHEVTLHHTAYEPCHLSIRNTRLYPVTNSVWSVAFTADISGRNSTSVHIEVQLKRSALKKNKSILFVIACLLCTVFTESVRISQLCALLKRNIHTSGRGALVWGWLCQHNKVHRKLHQASVSDSWKGR